MKIKARVNYKTLPLVLDGEDVQMLLGIGHAAMSELFQKEDFPKLVILKRNLVLKESFFQWLNRKEEKR